jgi:glycosyltransferase involved in cell wall biosynthesis
MSLEKNPHVLIALPAKDEEKKIGDVLDKIQLYFPDKEILIVDDGSDDGTARVAVERGVRLLQHDRNYGYARALQSARDYALSHGFEYLVLCDADGQHEPRDIGKIFEALTSNQADYVIASREMGSAPHGDPFIHRYGRKLYSALVSLLFYPTFRRRITDSSSGFKGWDREAMQLFDEIFRTTNRLHDGRINDLEELFIIAKHRLRVLEVPARFYKRKDDYSRIYANYGLSGKHFNLKDFYFMFFSWPWLFVRTVLRNIFRKSKGARQ